MSVLVTYDVPDRHRELKSALFAMGYTETVRGSSGDISYLPNTTVYHNSKTVEQGRDDLQAVTDRLTIRLERCIASSGDGWHAIKGAPFGS